MEYGNPCHADCLGRICNANGFEWHSVIPCTIAMELATGRAQIVGGSTDPSGRLSLAQGKIGIREQ